MPGRDGTGPLGKGNYGRRGGMCNRNTAVGNSETNAGRGMRRGRGMGRGQGRGQGRGRGMGRGTTGGSAAGMEGRD